MIMYVCKYAGLRMQSYVQLCIYVCVYMVIYVYYGAFINV